MCRMGTPEILITDQGREFVNRLSSKLYEITNTEHRITSAYHPQVSPIEFACKLHAICDGAMHACEHSNTYAVQSTVLICTHCLHRQMDLRSVSTKLSRGA